MKSFYNLISHIKNAGMVQNASTLVPISKLNLVVLNILYREGIIRGYCVYDSKFAKVFVSYLPNALPLSGFLKIISTPSRRVYITWKKLVNNYSGIFCLVSTSSGVMTGTEAIRCHLGGELLCARYYYLFKYC